MGRSSYSQRSEANRLIKIAIYRLNKPHLLGGYKSYKYAYSFSWKNNFTGEEGNIGIWLCTQYDNEFILFDHTVKYLNDETKNFNQKFPLTQTPCNYGGKRYWFICSPQQNGERCGRRIGVLYFHGGMFACRHCHNLTYSSKKLSGRYKAAGNIISFPDVDAARKAVKREYYNGKITRKYARYLKIATRARYAYAMHLGIATEMVNERKARMIKKVSPDVRRKFYKLHPK